MHTYFTCAVVEFCRPGPLYISHRRIVPPDKQEHLEPIIYSIQSEVTILHAWLKRTMLDYDTY
jgi:hypothetical protein